MAERHQRPLVSIVIPIRNSAAFLEKCCNSVKNQTYGHWEALLIDDNSTDESATIAARFVRTDSRFHLMASGRSAEDPPGPWLPRNQGLQASRGSYVAFLDADDLWLPEKLNVQLNLLEQEQYDLCICPYFRFSSQTGFITELRKPPTRHWPTLLKLFNPIPLSTVVIRRELMTTGFRAVCHEDHDAWRRLFATRHIRHVCCAQALAAYRIHPQNLTGSWWRKLSMKRAQQKEGVGRGGAVTLAFFLLIHSLYFLRSLPWRIQCKSIESIGFTDTHSISH